VMRTYQMYTYAIAIYHDPRIFCAVNRLGESHDHIYGFEPSFNSSLTNPVYSRLFGLYQAIKVDS